MGAAERRDETQPDALTLRAALIESNNAAAADLQQQVGIGAGAAAGVGRRACRRLARRPSLALGTGVVTPLELTTALHDVSGGGRRADAARACCRSTDADGTEVFAQPIVADARADHPRSRFRWSACCATSSIAAPAAPARALGVAGPVGGKTGTTDDYHDAWFVGFSSAVVAGVWVGFDQPAPIGRERTRRAWRVPIWADFMKRIAKCCPAEGVCRAAGAPHRGAVQRVACAAGRRLSALRRVLQGRRRRAERPVSDPPRVAAEADRAGRRQLLQVARQQDRRLVPEAKIRTDG